jgi:hypothetical protein
MLESFFISFHLQKDPSRDETPENETGIHPAKTGIVRHRHFVLPIDTACRDTSKAAHSTARGTKQ